MQAWSYFSTEPIILKNTYYNCDNVKLEHWHNEG